MRSSEREQVTGQVFWDGWRGGYSLSIFLFMVTMRPTSSYTHAGICHAATSSNQKGQAVLHGNKYFFLFCWLSLVPATATQSWLTCHHTDSTSSFQGLPLLFIHASNGLFAAMFFKGFSSESVVSEMTLNFKVKESYAYNWFIKPIFFTIYCI